MGRKKQEKVMPKTVSTPETKEEVKVESAQVEQKPVEAEEKKPEPKQSSTKVEKTIANLEDMLVGMAMLGGDYLKKVNAIIGRKPLEGFETKRIFEAELKLRDMHISIEPSTIKSVLKTDCRMDIDENYLIYLRTFAKNCLPQEDEFIKAYEEYGA